MAENKMKEVAKLLNLELGEEFKVYGWDGFCKITELGLERYVKETSWLMDSIMLMDLIKGTAKIIKLPKPILDEKEKEYLSAVIKPFRDKVFTVSKQIYGDAHYIQIRMSTLYRNTVYEFFNLPSFKPDTMYKGMELNKKYTLEELGL